MGHHLRQTFNHCHLDGRTNSHPLSSSLRGWLLATGEGRQKSATKSSLASNQLGIWICYLKAEVGSTGHSGTPGGSSRLTDSDNEWSCSHLTAGPRCTRVWHGTSNDVCGVCMDEAVWSVAVGEAVGGQSLSLPRVCPRMPKLKLSRRSIICSCKSLKATIASRMP